MMTIYDMRPHDLLCELLEKKAEDAISYKGYIAYTGREYKTESKLGDETAFNFREEDKIFLYPDIFDLSKSFEIKKSDILVCTKAPESFLPFGGVILWIKKNSEVISRRTEQFTGVDKFRQTNEEIIEITAGRVVIIPGSAKIPPSTPCAHKVQ